MSSELHGINRLCFIANSRRYLIIAYNTSIQIYSAADSLLVRRIPITTFDSLSPKTETPAVIVSMRLSKSSPEHVWVACSDGRVFYINWTAPLGPLQPSFTTKTQTARAMSIVRTNVKNHQDAVLILEWDKQHAVNLAAYAKPKETVLHQNLFNMKKTGFGLQLLETSEDGLHVVGAVNDRLFVGVANVTQFDDFRKLAYEFYSFDTPDTIASIDIRTKAPSAKKAKQGASTLVDVVVGGARGAIYVYRDVIARLQAAGKAKGEDALEALKYHWHRKAVHSVKWSRDGMFIDFTWRLQLTYDRQLHDLGWFRKCSRNVAARHRQEGLLAASVGQR